MTRKQSLPNYRASRPYQSNSFQHYKRHFVPYFWNICLREVRKLSCNFFTWNGTKGLTSRVSSSIEIIALKCQFNNGKDCIWRKHFSATMPICGICFIIFSEKYWRAYCTRTLCDTCWRSMPEQHHRACRSWEWLFHTWTVGKLGFRYPVHVRLR